MNAKVRFADATWYMFAGLLMYLVYVCSSLSLWLCIFLGMSEWLSVSCSVVFPRVQLNCFIFLA